EGLFVVGDFVGSLSFSYRSVEGKGGSDAFVVHFSSLNDNGAPKWIAQYGGAGWDEGQSIAEHEGSIYIGGTFTGTATLGHTTLTALGGAGDRDLHVTRIFRDGTPSWSQRIGSAGPDYGRGGLAASPNNTVHFTGSYGGNAITLGSKTLNGAGNLLTRINAPTAPSVGHFHLINADTDATVDTLGTLEYSNLVNYSVVGSKKINIRAITAPAGVGSVILELDGVSKTENAAPYTWAGDSPKNGGTDYSGFTPSTGKHKLIVSAYSGPKGTGVRSPTRTLDFFVIDAPAVSSLTLINAVTDKAVGTLSPGQKVNYATLGTGHINIRANLTPGNVGSVKFLLDDVAIIENLAPYTLAGDSPKDGGINYHAFTPAPGYHELEITIHPSSGGKGLPVTTFKTHFQVVQGGFVFAEAGRVGAGDPEPGTDGASLTAAPNPFTDRATLTFTAPEAGPARLEVYSPAGTRVSLLFDGPVEAGKPYRCTFEGGSLPAGLYVGRLTTGRRVTHTKLLLGR
ncbi:MAG: hypothetical protein ICV83_16545, partial [Cytophagales bacterium]|nr:hypothetical protein [Cytophagales bacterium]